MLPAKEGRAFFCRVSKYLKPFINLYFFNMLQTFKQHLNFCSVLAAFLLLTAVSCRDDEAAELPMPSITNIEVGHDNDEIGTIGEDFHFNADVTAGDKIDKIEVKILQRANEVYSKPWNHTVTWEEYRGSKNAHIHKHFDVPADAAEGKYDFVITVYDQNTTQLVEKRAIQLYLEESLPPGHHHGHDH